MSMLTVYGIVFGALAMMPSINWTALPVYDPSDQFSTIILVQTDTGAGPRSGNMETGKSGTGNETDAGHGVKGKEPQFGSDQPRSGDFSPNPKGTTHRVGSASAIDKAAGSEQSAGIGEKGSGQTRSTTERSGDPQPSASESLAKSGAQPGKGNTERAAKELQSKQPSNC
jgi:hypothetical protein